VLVFLILRVARVVEGYESLRSYPFLYGELNELLVACVVNQAILDIYIDLSFASSYIFLCPSVAWVP